MAKPPKLAKPATPGARYLYTPVYMRRHDEDAFDHCLITLEQCGHQFMAEHDNTQLRFRLPLPDDGNCPQCGSPIGGQFNWQWYTEGALDMDALVAQGVQSEGYIPAKKASQPKSPSA